MASLFLLRPTVLCHYTQTPLRHLKLIPPIHLGSKSPCKKMPASAITAAITTGFAGETNGSQEEEGRKCKTNDELKEALYQKLEGINRGIFGSTSAKKAEILELVELLESRNPTPQPTDNLLDKVDGSWKLVYSTISILGVKRTKLGLRDFITLGDFIQTIDVAKGKAVNVVKFSARGFKMLSGQLIIEATYKISSKTRVDIKLDNSTITPDQLMKLFQQNYDLLLSIFNPEGWLDITYVDESMRIGRDDKGNIFILERTEQKVWE